jgi:hypothetical protein
VTGKNAHWTGTGASLAKQRRRKRSPTCKALQGAAFAPGTRRDPGAPAAAHHTLGESPAPRRERGAPWRTGVAPVVACLRPSCAAPDVAAPADAPAARQPRASRRGHSPPPPHPRAAPALVARDAVSRAIAPASAPHIAVSFSHETRRDKARQGETGQNPRLHPEHEHVVVMLPFSQQIALPASPASPASNCHEVRLSHRRGGARV